MSNTYAKIATEQNYKGNKSLGFKHHTSMELTLTAFVGGDKHTQLTVQTSSTIEGQSGIAYICLGDKEVDLLIAALLERKLGKISSTSDEQSIFCPAEESEAYNE